MKASDLKQLIRECVREVLKESSKNKYDGLKKVFTDHIGKQKVDTKLKASIEAALRSAWDNGWEAGNSEGYQDGYSDGAYGDRYSADRDDSR